LSPFLINLNMNSTKNILFIFGSITISIVLTILLVEILLRLIGFQFNFLPTKVQFGWPDPIILEQRYRVDRDLLWVPKNYRTKIKSWTGKHPSIVFMGCSCTEMGQYDLFLKSFIDRLQPDNNITSVNMGVSGWSSYQGLQQLKRDILPMKPRIITIYYGWNDHWKSFGIKDKDIGKHNLKHPVWLKLSELRIIQLINRALFTPRKSRVKTERVPLTEFTHNLIQIVQIAKDNNIIPILLTAPSSHQRGKEPVHLKRRWLNDLNSLIPLHKKYVQAVRNTALKEEVHIIDLYAEFQQCPQKELNKYFSKDGIHLLPEGDKKIARHIYDYLLKNNLLYKIDLYLSVNQKNKYIH